MTRKDENEGVIKLKGRDEWMFGNAMKRSKEERMCETNQFLQNKGFMIHFHRGDSE